jgi:cell division transport system permease protein
MRLQFVLSEMFLGLRRNLTLTLAVIVTVAVSLALTGAGLLLRSQVHTMKGFWYDKVEVSVFLCTAGDSAPPCNSHVVTDAQRQQINTDLAALPDVERVYYESSQEAYAHFKEQFKDSQDLVKNVTPGELGDSFRVKLRDPKKFDVVASAFDGRPGVASVQDQRRILSRFFAVLNAFQTIALITAVGVLMAAVILIANTIRVAVYSRRREIGIMRLVGASNLYVQLPFLLEGVLTGLIGGLLSFCGVVAIKSFLIDGKLKSAFRFNATAFVDWHTVLSIGFLVAGIGVVVSAVVAFVTLNLSRATRV